MQRWGKSSNGKIRFRCPDCKVSGFRERRDLVKQTHLKLFNNWLLGNRALKEIAAEQKVTRRTLQRWFLKFQSVPSKQEKINIADEVIIIDGTYLGKNKGQRIVVLIVRTKAQVVKWKFCSQECYETWRETLRDLAQPKAIVCDGQKGMAKAIHLFWGDVTIQRCLFHIESWCLSKLTLNPTHPADQHLRQLCLQISRLNTLKQRDKWFEQYVLWKWQYDKYLHDKISYLHPINDKLISTYAHKRTRQVVSTIDHALPNMFHYLHDPDIPRTSNHIEGGTNSRLKELIHRHRGLTVKRKIILTNQYLRKQQKRK